MPVVTVAADKPMLEKLADPRRTGMRHRGDNPSTKVVSFEALVGNMLTLDTISTAWIAIRTESGVSRSAAAWLREAANSRSESASK